MPSHIPVPREFSVYTGFTKPIAQDLRLDRQLVALRGRAAAKMEVSPTRYAAAAAARAGRVEAGVPPSHAAARRRRFARRGGRSPTLPEVSDLP